METSLQRSFRKYREKKGVVFKQTQVRRRRGTRFRKFWLLQEGLCIYCLGRMTTELGFAMTATWDHIVPKSKGGPTNYDNLILACSHCNHLKRDKSVAEFEIYLQRRKGRKPMIYSLVASQDEKTRRTTWLLLRLRGDQRTQFLDGQAKWHDIDSPTPASGFFDSSLKALAVLQRVIIEQVFVKVVSPHPDERVETWEVSPTAIVPIYTPVS